MSIPKLDELSRRCQKPDSTRIGNWMARRITRPLALRVTRVVLPLGVSAHAVTLSAWAAGLAAAFSFGWGSIGGWLLGAALLQLWYLLDHVDGQLARYRGAESLDGAALDYLMHHTLNLLLPVGVGWGFAGGGHSIWLLAGLAWGTGSLLIGLVNDARYKSFIKRLKRLRGELRVIGGGGGRPVPPKPLPLHPKAALAWCVRKFCEPHFVMNALTLLAILQWLLADPSLFIGRVYLAGMAFLAVAAAAAVIIRSLRRGAAEEEFAAWFQLPDGSSLTFKDGWWSVTSDDVEGAASKSGALNEIRSEASR